MKMLLKIQKVLILMVVDNKWTDVLMLDQLRQSVGCGYAQNPTV